MGRRRRHTTAQLEAMVDEINQQTDRGAAVIAAAVLDELLDVCLQARLIEMPRDRYDALFGFDRPLGTFSAKIELGMALGFYSVGGYRRLHAIREIRNKFSHRIDPITFDHEEIAPIVDRNFSTLTGDRRHQFESAFSVLSLLLLATQLGDIRIKSLRATHPEIYAKLLTTVDPATGKLAADFLREGFGADPESSS